MGKKLNIILSTLNVFLSIIGYQFVMIIFSNNMEAEGASQVITIPYRAVSVLIPIIVIIINYREHYKMDRIVKILWFYWLLLFIRFINDFFIKTDVNVEGDSIMKTFLFMGPMTLLPMFAVMKSKRFVDIHRLFKWTYIIISLSVIIIIAKQGLGVYTTEYSRMRASMALGSLGTGQLGLMGIIMSISYLYLYKNKPVGGINLVRTKLIPPIGKNKCFINRIFAYFISFISVLILLRSGSRGPLLVLIIILAIFLVSRIKNKIISLSIIIVCSLLGYLLYDFLLNIVGNISPMLAARIIAAGGNQFETRYDFYNDAIDIFLDNPFTGGAFGHYGEDVIMHTHNAFLDSFMQLGIWGGIIIYLYIQPIRRTIQFINYKDCKFWVGLILSQSMISTMFSSSFYNSYEISILITYLFTYSCCKRIRKNTSVAICLNNKL